MTNGSNDRLERIERILEAVAQRQDAISQQQEINTRFIELLGTRIDSNAKAIEAITNRIADVDRTLAEAVGRALAGIEALTERAEEDRVNFQEFVEHTNTAVAGINATLAAVKKSCARRGRGSRGDEYRSGSVPTPEEMHPKKSGYGWGLFRARAHSVVQLFLAGSIPPCPERELPPCFFGQHLYREPGQDSRPPDAPRPLKSGDQSQP